MNASPNGGAGTPPPGAPTVEARGVVKHYGAHTALDGVDLVIAPGESILLAGPNGAGKSTLLRILATLLRPTAGALRLFGSEPGGAGSAALRRRLGLLAHHTFLYAHLTALENLRFYAGLYGVALTPDRARSALSEVGLDARGDDPVRAFSRGMQQRLAIARAFLHGPDLLLLDEPFTGLDRDGIERLSGLLRARVRGAVSCLLATHDLAVALPLATRVVILAGGRVAADRPAAGLDPAALAALYGRAAGA